MSGQHDECNDFLAKCVYILMADTKCGHTVEIRSAEEIPVLAARNMCTVPCPWCSQPEQAERDHFHSHWRGTRALILKSMFSVSEAREFMEMSKQVRDEEMEP